MKRLLAILLALAALLTFAACTETNTIEPASGNGEPVPSSSAEPDEEYEDALSFLGNDEIYFDIHLTQGLFDKTSIRVGDQVLTESGKATYTGDEEIVFEGSSDKDDDVYVMIVSSNKNERATSYFTLVEASLLSELLAKTVPLHKPNKEKILVIVTDTKDGYDHSFDSALSDTVKLALEAA